MRITPELSLDDLFKLCSTRLETKFNDYLKDIPALELKSAMEYSLLNGGKRIRPLLVYATGSIFSAKAENLDIAASSIELIHTYSLIHDDLPCLDNADFRRGKPACHRAFDESIALLTGDALQPLAIQTLACEKAPLKAERRLKMISVLSKTCGPFGMVAGQALDMTVMSDASISDSLLVNIYRLKTGALISACIELGRLSSDDDDEFNQRALQEFGNCIGLAFQIQDDILDMEGSENLGKPQNIDVKNKKITYPKLHGLTEAKLKVESLYAEALEAINYLGNQARLLRELSNYLLYRKN